ncbi:hypothetical protein ACFQ2B_13815 [Streptomyces stramineus]
MLSAGRACPCRRRSGRSPRPGVHGALVVVDVDVVVTGAAEDFAVLGDGAEDPDHVVLLGALDRARDLDLVVEGQVVVPRAPRTSVRLAMLEPLTK